MCKHDANSAVELFAPEIRPIARWLLTCNFQPYDLYMIAKEIKDRNEHIVDLAYQYLGPRSADVGKFLAIQDSGVFKLPKAPVEELCEAGFLQEAPLGWVMPRLVQKALSGFAVLSGMTFVREYLERTDEEKIELRWKHE